MATLSVMKCVSWVWLPKSSGHASRRRRVVKLSPMNDASKLTDCGEQAYRSLGRHSRFLMLEELMRARKWPFILVGRGPGRETGKLPLYQMQAASVDRGDSGVADQ